MANLKNLLGQTAVYGLSSIVGRFLNYLLTPLYTYQFIAQEYGVVTEMYAYVAFLVVLLTFGMETAFFRFASGSGDRVKAYNTALLPVMSTALAFMVICLIFAPQLASWISYAEHPEYITWFAMIVGLDAISAIPLARLRQENRASRFAFVNLSSIALNIGLNLFFIAYCKVLYDNGQTNFLVDTFYRADIGVGYIFIANLAASVFKAVLLLPQLKGLKFRIEAELLKKMLAYAGPLLVVGLAGIANENLDRLLLKYLLLEQNDLATTMAQVGIYGACYKVSILITLMVQAYRYAAEPFFFSKSSESDARETYADMLKYFVLICLFVFLALMTNIDIVMLFVGEEYRVGVTIVPMLLMANIFLGIYYNLSVWYKLTDKTIYGAYIAVFGAIITVTFNLMLIPVFGYVGSAWATLACYASMTAASFIIGRRHYRINYPLFRILIYFVIALSFYFALERISPPGESLRLYMGNALLLGLAIVAVILERPKKIIT